MKYVTDIKKYYDNFWSDKNNLLQEKSDLRDYEREARNYVLTFIMKYFNGLKNIKILEIGPGKGYDAINFANLGAKVTAIDISNNSLRLTRDLALKHRLEKNVKVINMDAHKLEFKENEFDLVFILSTLMHLDYLKVVEECKRVLKRNGVLVSIEPINNNPLIKIYRIIFSEFKDIKPNYLTYNDLKIISNKFRISKIRIFYLFSFLTLILRDYGSLYKILSRLFKKLEKIIIRILPSLEKNCWLSATIYIK